MPTDRTPVGHPHAAEALRARTAVIADRWSAAAGRHVPGAAALTPAQLRHTLPDVLAELAHTLAAPVPATPPKAGGDHGRGRFGLDYALDDLLVEFALLRPILLEEVADHLGRGLSEPEVAAVLAGLDAAQRHAVTRFVDHQQDHLRTATDAQAKCLSTLSHDLRGGLNGVLLMVEVLKRELAPEPKFAESVADLDTMRQSILDTVATMDRILYAERFRSGRVVARPAPFDLAAAVRDLLVPFARPAAARSVRLVADLPPTLPVVADRELVGVVVQNLLSNAVRLTARDTAITVTVTAPAEVRVADRGPGLPPDRLAALLQPAAAASPPPGLGLSIARQAAALLGGHLTAESAVGVGSTFVLTLP